MSMIDVAKELAAEMPSEWEVYIVGGAVRDICAGILPHDIDLEVFHATPDELVAFAQRIDPHADVVGKSFGVVKLQYHLVDFDLSLPRHETKRGLGHKGFDVVPDPEMSTKEACARRDFTINSMMLRLPDLKLIDHYGGRRDLRFRYLRPTSPHFVEDPLRVLRGMQFAGRFNLMPTISFVTYGKELLHEHKELSKDRIWHEWYKWAQAIKPSMGIRALEAAGWLDTVPYLEDLEYIEQDSLHHPEGNCLTHTLHAVDAVISKTSIQPLMEDDLPICVFAALCHDFGKIDTTVYEDDGSITSRGHDVIGEGMALEFMEAIGAPKEISLKVSRLVRCHMAHLSADVVSHRMVRRLARDLFPATIEQWGVLAYADHSSRPPLPTGMHPNAQRIVDLAEEMSLEYNPPSHIMLGRHLIGLGMKPGKEFGVILSSAYEAQLDGEFSSTESGLVWIQNHLEERGNA